MAKSNKKGNKVVTAKGAVNSVEETVETIETVEVPTVIEQTEETVLDAASDITAGGEGEQEAEVVKVKTCSDCGAVAETNEAGLITNFSLLQSGDYRNICKPCQTAKSGEWTTRVAPYRKQYARANQLLRQGIPVIVPNAKDWKEGDALMTIEYSMLDGQIVPNGTEGATFYPSRDAEVVYSEQQEAAKAIRDAEKAERELIAENARLERKAQREAEKAERDAKRAEEAEAKKAEREAQRLEQAQARAEKAAAAKVERDRLNAENAAKRQAERLAKAEAAKIERDKKALERAAANTQKALDRAAKAAADRQAKIDASMQKTLDALKGKNRPQPTA